VIEPVLNSKHEIRAKHPEGINSKQVPHGGIQNTNDPNPAGCHCERSEAISWDCRVASLLAMTTFFCFTCLREAPPCGAEAGAFLISPKKSFFQQTVEYEGGVK